MASDLRRGFQLAHISEPSTRMVGRSSARRAMRERLRFLDPGDAKALQALDAFGGVILHALEDDEAIAGRFYAVVEDAEQRPDAELLDLLSMSRFADCVRVR